MSSEGEPRFVPRKEERPFRWSVDQIIAFRNIREVRPEYAELIRASRRVMENPEGRTPEMIELHRRRLDLWGFLPSHLSPQFPPLGKKE